MIRTTITPREQADRLAIRELVDAYAHCADRRGLVRGLHRIAIPGSRPMPHRFEHSARGHPARGIPTRLCTDSRRPAS